MESCRLPDLKYAIFSRTGRKTKKLPRSKLFLSRPSEQPGLGAPQKGVNCNFSSPDFDKSMALESSRSRMFKYAVSAGLAKRWKNYRSFIFWLKTEKFRSTDLNDAPLEGSNIFLHHSSTGHTVLEIC